MSTFRGRECQYIRRLKNMKRTAGTSEIDDETDDRTTIGQWSKNWNSPLWNWAFLTFSWYKSICYLCTEQDYQSDQINFYDVELSKKTSSIVDDIIDIKGH